VVTSEVMSIHNGGDDVQDMDWQWQLYIPSSFAPFTMYSLQILGPGAIDDSLAGRHVVTGCAIVLSMTHVLSVHATRLTPSLYMYTANKRTPFGSWPPDGTIALPYDQWNTLRVETRGGWGGGFWSGTQPVRNGSVPSGTTWVGDTSGVCRFYVNNVLSNVVSGIAWVRPTGLGWRHVGILNYTHGHAVDATRNLFFRNISLISHD
jgi:hypothetical protein